MNKIEAWLEKIGCEGELEVICADASARKYYRLKSSMHSGVVMDSSLEKESLEAFIELEHRLYEAGVRVGKIFTYDKEQGFVFLEDLGSTHLIDVIENDFELFYDKAIDTIVKMQETNTEGLAEYDAEHLRFEMDLMNEWYLKQYKNITLNAKQEATLDAILEVITKEVLSQPQGVFVHKDFHSKNLMFGCSEEIVVIDYQDARIGALTYDLVSLLRDVYVELDVHDVERMVLGFRDKKGLTVEDETFLRWFDFMGLQRHIKILGVFARLHLRDGKDGYLQHTPLTLKYIKSVASKYKECEGLLELLEV